MDVLKYILKRYKMHWSIATMFVPWVFLTTAYAVWGMAWWHMGHPLPPRPEDTPFYHGMSDGMKSGALNGFGLMILIFVLSITQHLILYGGKRLGWLAGLFGSYGGAVGVALMLEPYTGLIDWLMA